MGSIHAHFVSSFLCSQQVKATYQQGHCTKEEIN